MMMALIMLTGRLEKSGSIVLILPGILLMMMMTIMEIMEEDEDGDDYVGKDDVDVQIDEKLLQTLLEIQMAKHKYYTNYKVHFDGRQSDMEFVEIFTEGFTSCDKSSLLMAGNATAAAMEINKKSEAELFKLKQVPFALHCTCIFPKLVASGLGKLVDC